MRGAGILELLLRVIGRGCRVLVTLTRVGERPPRTKGWDGRQLQEEYMLFSFASIASLLLEGMSAGGRCDTKHSPCRLHWPSANQERQGLASFFCFDGL